MCTSLQSMFLNTNKKAVRQEHRLKLKSHFPASDAAISTLTLTLALQLQWSSHNGCGKETVPRWEVNYLAWHKKCWKGKFHLLSFRQDIFVQISPCHLVKQLPTCPIYILILKWFQFCILYRHAVCLWVEIHRELGGWSTCFPTTKGGVLRNLTYTCLKWSIHSLILRQGSWA